MVVVAGRRAMRALPWLRLLVLLPVSLLMGHEAVFRAQYGLGDAFRTAMTAGGHEGYWAAFSAVIAALTVGVLARQAGHAARLRWRLRLHARTTRARTSPGPPEGAASGSWSREFRAIWPVLFAITAAAFAVQENLEHVALGQQPHGLGSLIGAEHPFAVPVLAMVSALVAAVGGLVRWRVRMLEMRLARAAARPRRRRVVSIAPPREWPLPGSFHALRWILVRLLAGRAPPVIA